MWAAIQNLFRVEAIRGKIFITLSLLFIARIGLNIPLPGVNYAAYKLYVEGAAGAGTTQIVGLRDLRPFPVPGGLCCITTRRGGRTLPPPTARMPPIFMRSS